MQLAKSVQNILDQLRIPHSIPILHGDNKASIDFIQQKGQPKGVRHMQLRMWMLRENYDSSQISFLHVPGATLVADYLTKLAFANEHNTFAISILGLALMGATDIREFLGYGPTIGESSQSINRNIYNDYDDDKDDVTS